jgi:hypothetical protein
MMQGVKGTAAAPGRSVKVSDATYRTLQRLARREQRTIAATIDRTVHTYLEQGRRNRAQL